VDPKRPQLEPTPSLDSASAAVVSFPEVADTDVTRCHEVTVAAVAVVVHAGVLLQCL